MLPEGTKSRALDPATVEIRVAPEAEPACQRPVPVPSLARKYRLPPKMVRSKLPNALPPGFISCIRLVPPAVPFDRQTSDPWMPSMAAKKRVLPTTVNPAGLELPVPGLISATIYVPAAVPSLRHNSAPLFVPPLVAWKYIIPFITVSAFGDDEPVVLISSTMTVPARVPSLVHSSLPEVPLLAAKKIWLPSAVMLAGIELPVG